MVEDSAALLPFDDGNNDDLSHDSFSGPVVSGIYQICNRRTGRIYIGKSQNISARWLSHCRALNRGIHVNDDLQGDWEIYGANAFEFTILEEITGHRALRDAEARHLARVTNPYNVQSVPPPPREKLSVVDKEPLTPLQFLTLLYGDVQSLETIYVSVVLSGVTESLIDLSVDEIPSSALKQGPDVFEDYAVFQDYGYMGLYDGRTARDIAARKGLGKDKAPLGWMGGAELAANWFRITQIYEKLQQGETHTREEANATHYMVGREVREAIARIGGADARTPAHARPFDSGHRARRAAAAPARRPNQAAALALWASGGRLRQAAQTRRLADALQAPDIGADPASGHSQPFSSAIWAASIRFRPPVFCIALER